MIGIIASQAFSPNKIPGLALWLDGNDRGTIEESGGKVSEWKDKSGNGIDFTQGIIANQPVTGANTVNGNNVVNFDGRNHFIPASVEMVAKMVFIVARLETGFFSFSGPFSENGISTDDENIRLDGLNVAFRGNGNENFADFTFNDSVPANGGETRINGFVSVPPAIVVNTPFILSAVAPVAHTFIPQISQDFNDRFWKGDIAEVIIYDVEPSLAFRVQLEKYLSDKWEISLAPSQIFTPAFVPAFV